MTDIITVLLSPMTGGIELLCSIGGTEENKNDFEENKIEFIFYWFYKIKPIEITNLK